jgi:malate synthase-like protein
MARDLHMNYVRIGSLSVAKTLHEFIQQAAAPGTSISAEAFWSGFAELLRECGTRNRQLLQVRDELQSRIDQYHRERSGEPLDLGDYERFLRDIGYVLPEGNDFTGLRRIEWVILGVEDSTNLGIARGFCILAGLYLASMMDGTSIETPSAAVGYVFVSGFSAGADSTRDFR